MEILEKINYKTLGEECSQWLKDYAENAGAEGYTIGISGGIDSAVTSTLIAMTGMKLLVLEMPIHQGKEQVDRAQNHIDWLKENFENVSSIRVDLTEVYDVLYKACESGVVPVTEEQYNFSMANTRSRLRMMTLYQYAGTHKMLVAGTGNKVEDFGIGFYTKYGDGGVDISPIADLMKSEVYALGAELGVIKSILTAAPTDGLHSDGRTDEDQIGATYDELEWAMVWCESHRLGLKDAIKNRELPFYSKEQGELELSDRQYDVLEIYNRFHNSDKHKMNPIPVFDTKKYRKNGNN